MHLSTLQAFYKKLTFPSVPARKGSWRQDCDEGIWAGTHPVVSQKVGKDETGGYAKAIALH